MKPSDQVQPELNIERLARLASVDGQWWQDCDRQTHWIKRRASFWSYLFYAWIGGLIGFALGCAGWAYALLR